ncbi:MAG: VWA domain-containing protein [Bryobacteraceae bacterium]
MRPQHVFLWWLACTGFGISLAQTVADQNVPEMSTQDSSATFQTKVNLVLVPVVVRDRQGHAVGNLRREDFQLFDKGKAQVISKFSLEKSGGPPAGAEGSPASNVTEGSEGKTAAAVIPERYVAYLFDDLHLSFGDLANVRKAAEGHVATALKDTDRAAIYTTSGRTTLDFTDDRAKLRETLAKLRPQPMYAISANDCPDLTYYMADFIQNKKDQQALQAATTEVMVCESLPSQAAAQQQAMAAASRVVSLGEQDTRVTLSVFKDLIRRISVMPGQRTIILISPGFVTPSNEALEDKTEILDRAARANVIISSLDARGLYTTGPDATEQSYDGNATRIKEQYKREGALAEEDVLEELADGTGGTFIHNSNDLDAGLKRVAAAPEYLYVLGFSPQNLKMDGSFHKLKVAVKPATGMAVQARRGYYAPKHTTRPEETAKAEIRDAVFSRDEMHDIPVELHTQFFKSSAVDAKLTVLARVDLKRIRFQKVDGRNRNELTIVSALFDRNGNYIVGMSKVLTLRLRDETLGKLNSGITVKTSFDTKPGSYFVRLVVRDAEGQMMSAENGAVEIP